MISPDLMLLPVIGPADLSHILVSVVVLSGFGALLSIAGSSEKGIARTACRAILAYSLYEVLLVLPVALWLGVASPKLIVATMSVRATWLLFPLVVLVTREAQARRLAGIVPVIAAIGVVAWGVYSAATGGGGYYVEAGELRYRVLFGSAALLVAWPFVLAVSGSASSRYNSPLLAVALVGLLLTNHRSGVVAFVVAGVVCLAMSGRVRRIVPTVVPLMLSAIVVYILWGRELSTALNYTFLRLLDSGSPNAVDRLLRWRLAGDFFLTHPFNDIVWSWRYYSGYLSNPLRLPHNFALEIAIQEGIAGLVFYGSMFWIVVRGTWSWGRRDAVARALIGWLVTYVMFSLFNANHYLALSMPLLVGALAALAARADGLQGVGGPTSDFDTMPVVQP